VNPKANLDLSVISLKCLQKNLGRRYPTAGELADDLERWSRGEPILAWPVGPLDRMVRWCRRNAAIATLAGVLILALLVGTAVSVYFAVEADARQWRNQLHARTRIVNWRVRNPTFT